MARNKGTSKTKILGVAATGIAAGVAAGVAASTLADDKTRKKIIDRISEFREDYLEETAPVKKSAPRKIRAKS